jgi:hypothetical protein
MPNWLSRPDRIAAQMLAPASPSAAASPTPSPRSSLVAFDKDDPARVVAHLPAVLERYRAIIDTAEDCRLLSRAIIDDIQSQREEESRLHAKLVELQGWRSGDAATAIEETNEWLAIAREKLARHRRRLEAVGHEQARALAQNVVGYLTNCRGAQLSEFSGPEVKLQRGETYAQGIERCRRDLRAMGAKLEQIDAAPIPSAEAYRIACEEIDQLAQAGAPSVAALIQYGGKIGWQESVSWAFGLDPNLAIAPSKQLESLAHECWAHNDQTKAKIRALIQENSDDQTALMPDERAERRAEVLRDMLHIERVEEFFISNGDANIVRRPNCDARAVLGLDDNAPAPRND